MSKRAKSANPEKGAARKKGPEKVASESTLQRVRSGPRRIRKRGADDAVHNATGNAETVNRMSAAGDPQARAEREPSHDAEERKDAESSESSDK